MISRGVDAAELGQCKKVLPGGINTHTVEETPVLGLESVTERHHVKFQIVSTLKEIVTDHGIGSRCNVEVLGIGFLQAVAREVAGSIIEVVDIEDVIEEGTTEEQAGQLLTEKNRLMVATGNGLLNLEEVQLAGKKRMKAIDFLNGFRDLTGYCVR